MISDQCLFLQPMLSASILNQFFRSPVMTGDLSILYWSFSSSVFLNQPKGHLPLLSFASFFNSRLFEIRFCLCKTDILDFFQILQNYGLFLSFLSCLTGSPTGFRTGFPDGFMDGFPKSYCPVIIWLLSGYHPVVVWPNVLPLLISNFIKLFAGDLQCEFIRTFFCIW